MNRRSFLVAGSGFLATLAGCTAPEETDDSGDGTSGTNDTPHTATEAGSSTAAEADTEELPEDTPQAEQSSAGYQVRIEYSGDWSGTVGTVESTRSVDGSGTETFDIEGDPSIVSANAQKQDDSSDTLTVQILQDGDVVAEESTSAEYGVAQVTSDDGIGGGSGGSGGDSTSGGYEVRIQYSGEWSGSISAGGSSRSVDGSGTETFALDGDPDIISANGQKQDDGSGTLTVQILQDGDVVAEESTSAEYGVAQATHSSF